MLLPTLWVLFLNVRKITPLSYEACFLLLEMNIFLVDFLRVLNPYRLLFLAVSPPKIQCTTIYVAFTPPAMAHFQLPT